MSAAPLSSPALDDDDDTLSKPDRRCPLALLPLRRENDSSPPVDFRRRIVGLSVAAADITSLLGREHEHAGCVQSARRTRDGFPEAGLRCIRFCKLRVKFVFFYLPFRKFF